MASTPTTTPLSAPAEPLRTVPLGLALAPAAFALSAAAGWNQTVDDWRLLLGEGEAVGQLTAEGELVASALLLPYGDRLAWIAMILTSADYRGRGLATRNLQWALERSLERQLIAGLAATPEGTELYRSLGFQDVCGVHRLLAEQPRPHRLLRSGAAIRPVQAARDLDAIARLDARVFGAERRRLLAYLSRSQARQALLAEARGDLAGFVLARTGCTAVHIGPLIAHTPDVASLLLAQALVGLEGPVSIDVPTTQTRFLEALASAGFAPVRSFTRMLQAPPEELGDLSACFAVAGPEFG